MNIVAKVVVGSLAAVGAAYVTALVKDEVKTRIRNKTYAEEMEEEGEAIEPQPESVPESPKETQVLPDESEDFFDKILKGN